MKGGQVHATSIEAQQIKIGIMLIFLFTFYFLVAACRSKSYCFYSIHIIRWVIYCQANCNKLYGQKERQLCHTGSQPLYKTSSIRW